MCFRSGRLVFAARFALFSHRTRARVCLSVCVCVLASLRHSTGAGESGKSTIFKQMKILYGVGFQPDDLKATVPVIHSNVIGSMQALCTATDTLGIPVASADEKAYILTLDPDEDPCEGKTAEAIKTLWTDDGIQSAYEQRSKFQLNDSAKYYFEKLDVISAPGYVASIEDLLKSRVRTSGIVEECYKIEDTDFVCVGWLLCVVCCVLSPCG